MSLSNMFEKYSEQISKMVIEFTPKIIAGILIFFGFRIIARIAKVSVEKLLSFKNESIARILRQIVYKLFLLIGIIQALGTLGIDVSALVTGLGLTGFALSFAFKDMLSSFISGIFIFLYQPFKIGDHVNINGKEGLVKEINLRYVTIEKGDSRILIPNSVCTSKTIEVLQKK